MMTRFCRMTALLVTLALPIAAEAGPSTFTLGKGVPSDVFLYAHGAYNPEHEYLNRYWEQVWKAFKASGVIEDVHKLIATAPPDAKSREQFEKFWKRAGELISGVDWQAQVHEFVYAGRMSAPMPEHVILLRYDDDKAAVNAEAFAAVLKEIADVAGPAGPENGVTYSAREAHGARIWTLGFREVPFINLRVARLGPVVALAADQKLLDECLSMLSGSGDKSPLVGTERFRQAMAKLPPPEDSLVFFDVQAMLSGVQSLLDYAREQAASEKSEVDQVFSVLKKVLDELRLCDYLASTIHTEGYRQLDETLVVLTPDAEKSRLYKVFCKPEKITRFDRFIPQEASGYSVTAGVDWSAFYAAVLDFIGNEVPDGKKALAKWDEVQNEIGFHPDRDIFNWLGGEMVSVTLPAASPSPFSTADWVLLIKVRDEKAAAQKVKTGLDKLNQFLTQMQQPLTSQPAEVEGASGFRTITHPLMAMFLRPVYGVAEGYLVIGSSPEAVQMCLATGRGNHPGVAHNERVRREGLLPDGPVVGASFADLSSIGKDIAQALMSLGMVSAMVPDQPDTKPIKAIFAMAGKLGPAVMKIDFFLSQSAVTTYDGRVWHSRSVINYRPPKAGAEVPASGGR